MHANYNNLVCLSFCSQSDVCKPKTSLPSAAASTSGGLEENNVAPMNGIDTDACLEDDVTADEINERDSSECEDARNDLYECFCGEMPALDDLDPVDPVDGIQETESVDDCPIYPNARITNAVSMLLIMTFALNHKLL